jgi:hypothetical protein
MFDNSTVKPHSRARAMTTHSGASPWLSAPLVPDKRSAYLSSRALAPGLTVRSQVRHVLRVDHMASRNGVRPVTGVRRAGIAVIRLDHLGPQWSQPMRPESAGRHDPQRRTQRAAMESGRRGRSQLICLATQWLRRSAGHNGVRPVRPEAGLEENVPSDFRIRTPPRAPADFGFSSAGLHCGWQRFSGAAVMTVDSGFTAGPLRPLRVR